MTLFTLPGKVYLIGAGPGSADLLTIRGAELLKQADVVLHDELVSDEVLALIPARAAVQNVGKRCGTRGMPQQEINKRMVYAARQGQTVIRLKGGDPLIFGRLQEEIEALNEASVAFEIVPGVTAASAAAAAAQIPLTERNVASKLVFVSNHGCAGKARDWHESVTQDSTLVFYMPGSELSELVSELRCSGLSFDTPCLVLSNVELPGQSALRTSLGDLLKHSHVPSPRLLIVGALAATARKTAQAEKEAGIERPQTAERSGREVLLDWQAHGKKDEEKIQDDAVEISFEA